MLTNESECDAAEAAAYLNVVRVRCPEALVRLKRKHLRAACILHARVVAGNLEREGIIQPRERKAMVEELKGQLKGFTSDVHLVGDPFEPNTDLAEVCPFLPSLTFPRMPLST